MVKWQTTIQRHQPLPVRCPPELRQALKVAAAERGLSVSEYVRMVLVASTAAVGAYPPPPTRDREEQLQLT